MKERPILFSAPMVRAILDGRKTQTRRTVKLPKWATGLARYSDGEVRALGDDGSPEDWSPTCPHGAPGDRLWVRETWCAWERIDHPIGGSWARELEERGRPDILCRADFERRHGTWERRTPGGWIERVDRWQSSLLMPRWASRITLEVTDVRLERLHDITEQDAIAEGARYFPEGSLPEWDGWKSARRSPWSRRDGWSMCEPSSDGDLLGSARMAFANMSGHVMWDANPWVWRIAFQRVDGGAP